MPGATEAFELVLIETDGRTTALALPPGPAFIGSSAKCNVVIAHPSVAPVHAEVLTSSDGALWIRDLARRNDTLVNGEPIVTSKIEDGSFIKLGGIDLCLRATGRDSGAHGTAIRESATPAAAGLPQTASSPNLVVATPSGLNVQLPHWKPSGPALHSGPAFASDLDDGHGPTRLGQEVIGPNVIIAERYRVLGKIAEGGMGEVYKAVHIELDKPVALKVMKQTLGEDPGFAERFKREAVAASRIGQQNICDVSDFGRTTSGRFFFVMELLDGQTLAAIIRDAGALPVPRAIFLMTQLCHALAAAHSQGIVHRDLKPENVMVLQRLRQKDFVKVLDFGVAKVRLGGDAAGTQVGIVIGTPQYMAPEQASGLLTDARTDVYALGLIFYEMLQGKAAFTDETAGQLMAAQIYKDPPPLKSASGGPLHESLQQLVSRMLAKAPDKRPQTMDDVLIGLEECTAKLAAPIVPVAIQPAPVAAPIVPVAILPAPVAILPAPVAIVPAPVAALPRAAIVTAPMELPDQPLSPAELQATKSGSRRWPLIGGVVLLVAAGVAVRAARNDESPAPQIVEVTAPPEKPQPRIEVAVIAPTPPKAVEPPATVKPVPAKPAVAAARPRPPPTAPATPPVATINLKWAKGKCPLKISPASLRAVDDRIFIPAGITEVRLEADCPCSAQLVRGTDGQPYGAKVFNQGRPATLVVGN